MLNQQLAEELHKPIIKSTFIFYRQYLGADLADMQLKSKFNKKFRFALCTIDIYSKDAWVVPLKGKKSITITKAFQEILDKSKRKRNKTWVEVHFTTDQ